MAGFFSEDIVARVCVAAVEHVCHMATSHPSGHEVTNTLGAIVSAAGFPEIGIPIAVGGYLLGRWRKAEPATGTRHDA
jgi:hypothetical protein